MSEPMSGGILLAAINAKWIHPSLALRLLKANLGPLEENCDIIEFALRQPLREKIDPILAARPRILGLSVSIWNHTATLELLKKLHQIWETKNRPFVVLGGPEVSYLPPQTEIFRYADYCVAGEGEIAFRELCETIFERGESKKSEIIFINRKFQKTDITAIKSAYYLYSDDDIRKKLIYVEASRGCPFGCEFCLSARDSNGTAVNDAHFSKVREFPLKPFFTEMDNLIQQGVYTIKFLDRTFNLNIERARKIMEFFLNKIEENTKSFVVHFEMVPSRLPPELIETIARFPPGTLRLEIGIQTLNPGVSTRIGRQTEPERELAVLTLLRKKTNAIIHADLIAGLPGEDITSFGKGFDLLWAALASSTDGELSAEIQLGILKLLPGAAIARHNDAFGMCYNPLPPYEVTETAFMSANDLVRLKNFARFWELIVNRGLINIDGFPVFNRFMALSDSLFTRFGRNWGIAKKELQEAVTAFTL
jgi:radical SAM superfamily enzyme YgiQ (UPF0313 family)